MIKLKWVWSENDKKKKKVSFQKNSKKKISCLGIKST